VSAGLWLVLPFPAWSQDLDPRAYVHVPVDGTFVMVGLAASEGGIVTDPTLVVQDVQATVLTPMVGAGRSFGLLGRTAQVFGVLPFSTADMSGTVFGAAATAQRAGLSDMRLRVSWLVRGAPAFNMAQLAKAPRRTILGVSLNVSAPTGQYDPAKLINLGTNRWAFRPEVAVSQPIGQRWLFDAYAGLWLFTPNNESYPGTQVKTQAPLGSFQAHVSYNFQRQLWAALDLTYYVGGRTTVEDFSTEDMQSNVRGGFTVALPVGQRHSIKIAASRGAIVRLGANFNSYSFAWQTAWAPRPPPAPSGDRRRVRGAALGKTTGSPAPPVRAPPATWQS
jgi:hypothetical protein